MTVPPESGQRNLEGSIRCRRNSQDFVRKLPVLLLPVSGQFFEILRPANLPTFREAASVSCPIIDGGFPYVTWVVGAPPPDSLRTIGAQCFSGQLVACAGAVQGWYPPLLGQKSSHD